MSDYDERVLDLCDMDYDRAAETLAYIDRLREESDAARGIIATERGYRVRAEADAAALRAAGNALADTAIAWNRDNPLRWVNVKKRVAAWRSAAGTPATE